MTDRHQYAAAIALANQAPRESGRVDYLINRPSEGVHVPVNSLRLDCELGIIGDRWAATAWMKLANGSPDPRVQVSLTNTEVMRCFTGDGADAVFGCGDNLYVDFCLMEDHLGVGARLRIGGAVLEVSDVVNDGCGKFAQRFGSDALKFVRELNHTPLRLRGIFCLIVEPGEITVGDRIELCS